MGSSADAFTPLRVAVYCAANGVTVTESDSDVTNPNRKFLLAGDGTDVWIEGWAVDGVAEPSQATLEAITAEQISEYLRQGYLAINQTVSITLSGPWAANSVTIDVPLRRYAKAVGINIPGVDTAGNSLSAAVISATDADVIPIEYRPNYNMEFLVVAWSAGAKAIGRFVVRTDGKLEFYPSATSNANFSTVLGNAGWSGTSQSFLIDS